MKVSPLFTSTFIADPQDHFSKIDIRTQQNPLKQIDYIYGINLNERTCR